MKLITLILLALIMAYCTKIAIDDPNTFSSAKDLEGTYSDSVNIAIIHGDTMVVNNVNYKMFSIEVYKTIIEFKILDASAKEVYCTLFWDRTIELKIGSNIVKMKKK